MYLFNAMVPVMVLAVVLVMVLVKTLAMIVMVLLVAHNGSVIVHCNTTKYYKYTGMRHLLGLLLDNSCIEVYRFDRRLTVLKNMNKHCFLHAACCRMYVHISQLYLFIYIHIIIHIY